jgi:hypothetical protein
MAARYLRTSPLDLRMVLPLRVNLLRFVQKVLALAGIPPGIRVVIPNVLPPNPAKDLEGSSA